MTDFRTKKDGTVYPISKSGKSYKKKYDKRNLYGGQYRFSQELANVIKSYARSGHARFVHDMSAFIKMNHFDVDRMLISSSEGKNLRRKQG